MKELKEVLRAHKAIVSNNPVLPITESTYYENGWITVTNVDHYIKIKCDMPENLNGMVFDAIEKAMKINPTGVEMKGNMLRFFDGKKSVSVPVYSGEDFPLRETKYPTNIVYLDGILPKLKKAVNFVSKDQLRLAMTGVCIIVQKGFFEVVATDAHHLYKSSKIACEHIEDGKYILPVQIVKYLNGFKEVHSIQAHIVDNYMSIHMITDDGTQIEVQARLIDARYPDYNAVIPLENPNKFVYSKKELITVITEAQQFANEKTNQVNFDFKSNKVSAQDLDYSIEYQNDLPGNASFKDAPFAYGLNARLMLNSLKNCDGDYIKSELSTASRAMCTFDQSDDLFLNMPVYNHY